MLYAETSRCSGGAVVCEPRKSHDFATLGLVRRAPTSGQFGADPNLLHSEVADSFGHSPSANTHNLMSWTPTRTREDVVHVVKRFVAKEFTPRSAAGKIAIDESRTRRDRPVRDMSETEFRGEIRAALLSLLAGASPSAPVVRSTTLAADGSYPALRRVAPLRDVAAIVRGRHGRGGSVPAAGAREWRATVAQKLRSIDPTGAEGFALVRAARLRLDLIEIRNALQAVSTKAERQRGGKKAKRGTARAGADLQRDAVKALEEAKSAELASLVKTRAYLRGVDHFLAACTATEEIETYIFGEAR
jgi:hypothetical protein